MTEQELIAAYGLDPETPAYPVITNADSPSDSNEADAPEAADGGRRRGPTWRALRDETGLSLRELEERTGVNRGLLSAIERGFGPTPDRARQLLAFYDGAR